MFYSSKIASFALFFSLVGLATDTHAASAIPPELVAQAKKLSPSAQRDLAKRYGVDIDELVGRETYRSESKERGSLGAPGEPLRPPGAETPEVRGVDDRYDLELVRDREPEGDNEETPLKRFGENLFDKDLGTFAPVDNIPVPEGYRLGVGDELTVTIIGKESGESDVIIGRDGSVTLPKLGRLSLVGMTFPEAKKMLERRVRDQLIGSEVLLSMGSLRSINVFMAGEVKQPGNYSVSALTTLSQIIFIAGGVTERGSYRDIKLKRRGETVATFDIYDLLIFGDNSSDVRLQSGDVVLITLTGPQMSIDGEVLRPAIYEFREGASIASVLDMAGGRKARGYGKQALLKRYTEGSPLPSMLNIDLQNAEQMSMKARDGDMLSVRPVSDRIANPIAIEGPTELSGIIGWSQGLKVADVFGDLEGDLQPTADLDVSLVVRRKNSLNDVEIIPFSLSKAKAEPTSVDNLELNPFDRIVVLPLPSAVKDEFDLFLERPLLGDTDDDMLFRDGAISEEEQPVSREDLIQPIVEKLKQQARSGERAAVVRVSGAVQQPGEYPLLGGGSIDDLIKLSGGLKDEAYLKKVEVRRINLNEEQEAVVSIINLELNSDLSSNFKLLGRDALRINSIPNWSTDETVTLSGEFLFPGDYTISKGETIASLIARAGGFSDNAFLGAAQYVSATARKIQSEQLKKIYTDIERRVASRKAAGEFTEDSAGVPFDIDDSALGRVGINLDGIIAGDQSANRVVEAGDSLFVPKFSNTIGVVGEVYEPGTFEFQPGRDVKSYIQTAGGETTYALSKQIYILKADGSVRFSNSGGFLAKFSRFDDPLANQIQAGDVIVVPTNLDYDRPLERVTAVTNVVFQSLTSIAAFLSITAQ